MLAIVHFIGVNYRIVTIHQIVATTTSVLANDDETYLHYLVS